MVLKLECISLLTVIAFDLRSIRILICWVLCDFMVVLCYHMVWCVVHWTVFGLSRTFSAPLRLIILVHTHTCTGFGYKLLCF